MVPLECQFASSAHYSACVFKLTNSVLGSIHTENGRFAARSQESISAFESISVLVPEVSGDGGTNSPLLEVPHQQLGSRCSIYGQETKIDSHSERTFRIKDLLDSSGRNAH